MAVLLLQAAGRPGLSSLVPYALTGPAAAVVAGLLFPSLAQAFRPFVGPALLVMLAAMLLRIDRAHLVAHVRRPRLALIVMAWLIIGVPFLVAGVAQLAGLPSDAARCLVLLALAPAFMSGPALSLVLGLDAALATVAVVGTSFLAPLVLPALGATLTEVRLNVQPLEFMARLAVIVGGAALAAALLRAACGTAWLAMHRAEVDGLVVVARTAVALGAMAGLADGFAAVPEHMAEIGLWALAGNLGLQALGGLVFVGLGLRRALTVSLLTGNRTVALVFAALGTGADPVVASFLSWSFLVMYTLPVAAPRIYGWIARVAQPRGDGVIGGDGLHPMDRTSPASVPAREEGPIGPADRRTDELQWLHTKAEDLERRLRRLRRRTIALGSALTLVGPVAAVAVAMVLWQGLEPRPSAFRAAAAAHASAGSRSAAERGSAPEWAGNRTGAEPEGLERPHEATRRSEAVVRALEEMDKIVEQEIERIARESSPCIGRASGSLVGQTPWSWNTCLARSTPRIAMLMTASPEGLSLSPPTRQLGREVSIP